MLPFLLKNWKLIAIGGIVLLVFGLIFQVRVLQGKLIQAKSDNQSLIQLYSDDHRDLKFYQSQLGQEVAKNKTLQLSSKAMKELMESQDHKWLENFQGLKKSLKNLEIAQQVTARAYDSLKVLLQYDSGKYVDHNGDTIKFIFTRFNYQDEYAKIKATQVAPDSAVVIYDVKVPLQQAIYWDRKWFLGKKHFESEITSPNKNIAITKLETIFVKKKKK